MKRKGDECLAWRWMDDSSTRKLGDAPHGDGDDDIYREERRGVIRASN